MQPNAPPPLPSNPYDFIVNPQQPQKKGPFSFGGNSKTQRLLVVIIFGLIIITVFILIMSLLGRSDAENRQKLIIVGQKQGELIRVAAIGVEKARTNEARNLAITTELTLTSQQAALNEAVKKVGGKLDSKTIAVARDSKTDELLTKAEQSNNFDDVFLEKLRNELTEYANSVKDAYDSTSSKKTKDALEAQFNAAATLAGYNSN